MTRIKILLAGDTHGDVRNVFHKIDAAVVHGVQRIVVLGDFGLWWGYEGVEFIDTINKALVQNNRQLFAIPGNHENYDWWNAAVAAAQKSKATAHGWAYLRTHVLLSPRVHDFVWNQKQFVVAGGAVSIDKEDRLRYEREKGKRIWSPDEQLTDAEMGQLVSSRFGNVLSADRVNDSNRKYALPVDYLLTHDCSDSTPWKHRLKPDIESQIHRQRIDAVLRGIEPRFHFHGHMHEKYEWENRIGAAKYVSTYGLQCNRDIDSWGILDLDTDEFTWASDL